MNCPCRNEAELDKLLDYVAGRLDAGRTAALRLHVRDCAECAAFVAVQQEVWLALNDFSTPAVGREFNRGVWQKITGTEPWYAAVARGFRERSWRPVLPMAVAVVLITAGFAFDHARGGAAAIATVSVAEADAVQRTLDDLQLLQSLNAYAAEVVEPLL